MNITSNPSKIGRNTEDMSKTPEELEDVGDESDQENETRSLQSIFGIDHSKFMQDGVKDEKIVNVPCNHRNTALHLSWSLLLECV